MSQQWRASAMIFQIRNSQKRFTCRSRAPENIHAAESNHLDRLFGIIGERRSFCEQSVKS
jgi:hypothetical protein